MYGGAKPEFTEFGPYKYREFDNFTNLEYGQMTDAADGTTKNTVSMDFVQSTQFIADEDGQIDTPMWVSNQAAYGVWYQQNNTPKWRVYLTLIYSIVNNGLGYTFVDTGVYQMMSEVYKDADAINRLLLEGDTTTLPQAVAIFEDPYYGLNDFNNYKKWGSLLAGPWATLESAWKWELKTYFGLSDAQVVTVQKNFINQFETTKPEMLNALPVRSDFKTSVESVAYWQWAYSYVTKMDQGL